MDDLASIVEATMRGMQGASRASAAAAAAASVRVATELLLGQAEPSQVDEETKERVKAITPVVRQHVMAGSHDLRASIPGAARKLRNRASHHAFGAGPGAWKHELLEAASRPTSRSASGSDVAPTPVRVAGMAREGRVETLAEEVHALQARVARLEELASPDALGIWFADAQCGGARSSKVVQEKCAKREEKAAGGADVHAAPVCTDTTVVVEGPRGAACDKGGCANASCGGGSPGGHGAAAAIGGGKNMGCDTRSHKGRGHGAGDLSGRCDSPEREGRIYYCELARANTECVSAGEDKKLMSVYADPAAVNDECVRMITESVGADDEVPRVYTELARASTETVGMAKELLHVTEAGAKKESVGASKDVLGVVAEKGAAPKKEAEPNNGVPKKKAVPNKAAKRKAKKLLEEMSKAEALLGKMDEELEGLRKEKKALKSRNHELAELEADWEADLKELEEMKAQLKEFKEYDEELAREEEEEEYAHKKDAARKEAAAKKEANAKKVAAAKRQAAPKTSSRMMAAP